MSLLSDLDLHLENSDGIGLWLAMSPICLTDSTPDATYLTEIGRSHHATLMLHFADAYHGLAIMAADLGRDSEALSLLSISHSLVAASEPFLKSMTRYSHDVAWQVKVDAVLSKSPDVTRITPCVDSDRVAVLAHQIMRVALPDKKSEILSAHRARRDKGSVESRLHPASNAGSDEFVAIVQKHAAAIHAFILERRAERMAKIEAWKRAPYEACEISAACANDIVKDPDDALRYVVVGPSKGGGVSHALSFRSHAEAQDAADDLNKVFASLGESEDRFVPAILRYRTLCTGKTRAEVIHECEILQAKSEGTIKGVLSVIGLLFLLSLLRGCGR